MRISFYHTFNAKHKKLELCFHQKNIKGPLFFSDFLQFILLNCVSTCESEHSRSSFLENAVGYY